MLTNPREIGSISSTKEQQSNLAELSRQFVCKDCGCDHSILLGENKKSYNNLGRRKRFLTFSNENTETNLDAKMPVKRIDRKTKIANRTLAKKSNMINRKVPRVGKIFQANLQFFSKLALTVSLFFIAMRIVMEKLIRSPSYQSMV